MKTYHDICTKQKGKGIIEEVSTPGKTGETHYMPHHPIIGADKSTAKVRIVFDASARGNGPTLNDCLYKGPPADAPSL